MCVNSQIFPNFFILGFPKCGTTALSDYLSEHSNIFVTDPKEPEYFAEDFENRPVTSESEYLKLFKNIDVDRCVAVGEASVCYSISKVALKNIEDFVRGRARYIVIIRNPIDLVLSLHAQLVYTGSEKKLDFEDAWKSQKERRVGRGIPASCRDPKWLFYSDWGMQGAALKSIYDVVGKDSVKVILFDDFVSDTRSVYMDVLSFLDVDDDGRNDFPVVNERKYVAFPVIQSFLGISANYSRKLGRIIGVTGGFGIARIVSKVNATTRRNVPYSANREWLREYFSDDVKLLGSLVGKDLAHWLS